MPAKPWQLALIALFGLLAGAVVILTLIALILTPTLPALDDLSGAQLKVPLRVYTADGELLAEFGEEKRIPVKIEEVPDLLIKAVLAAEDRSFYYHHGVDFVGILRAALHNLRTQSTSQGASTITMQVARNFFLSPEKTYTRKIKEVLLAFKIERELSKQQILELYFNKIFLGHRSYGFAAAAQTYYGKNLQALTLPEMAMLAGLPKAPSRDNPLNNPENATERRNAILKQMLNLNFIDEAAYAEAVNAPLAAARHNLKSDTVAPYVAELVRQYMIQTYDEKTYAGGFHVYTTLKARHQQAAVRALRAGLLEYDRRHGYRGPAGQVAFRGKPDAIYLDDALKDYRVVGDLLPGVVLEVGEKSAQVYTQDGATVELGWGGLSWARRYIDENTLGNPVKNAADAVKPGDIIYLEAVEDPQQLPETGPWRLAQIPEVAGALVALRPVDGAVLALTGGFDFYQSSFNRVTQAERQPGSSIKPFIFSAALDKGFTAASTVSGAPIVMDGESPEEEWRPEDYSKKFFGPTRLRVALAQSLNLVAVRLLRALGVAYTVEYMERFGFDPAKLPRNLSLALGTASATPMQMVNAFTVFANGGYRVTPYFIARVEDANHNVLEQANPATVCRECDVPGSTSIANAGRAGTTESQGNPPAAATTGMAADKGQPVHAPRVLSPETSFLMASMMQDVIRAGTGRGALVLGRKDLAGKTGTTNDYRDAWFSGFNSEVAATAWVGFDQPVSLGRAETGGRTALPVWIDFMREALAGVPEKPPVPPETMVRLTINSETGKPTTPDDPEAMEEYFAPGTETPQDLPGTEGETDGAAAPARPPENIRENLF
ncbi:peptidase [Sulfuricaulis limicola]|uniref:Penicillin-binding protein 1A n=1 Tax=Sulfuricaulis limicola TaxID=1620215 RepID=A0A1B4XC71_9GAMM|nr:penicillin-binding protein 1A [Sulfuricaulis limicola]BAV32381.1 peptidase [Sulfuricaulis limicola]